MTPAATTLPFREHLEEHTRACMIDALAKTGGNVRQAAAALGMPRRTFVRRVGRFDLWQVVVDLRRERRVRRGGAR